MNSLRFQKIGGWRKDVTQHLRRILRSTQGDSFAEVLIALLIAGLGAAALATMVMSSTNVARSSQVALDKSYVAENAIAGSSSGSTKSVTITIEAYGITASDTADVILYTTSDPLYARYEVTP